MLNVNRAQSLHVSPTFVSLSFSPLGLSTTLNLVPRPFPTDLGDMLAPVACYMIVSLIMAWRAAAWAEARGRWAWLAAIGAIVFMCSDSMIAVNRFVQDMEGGASSIIMLTYWAAQTLMTASLVLEY